MPDASGRFKGISVPELPWVREKPKARVVDAHCGYTPERCPYGDACADCGKVK